MRKIDGRKAEIINRGRRFGTYVDFAVKHGYPDAAHDYWKGVRDNRKIPQEGEVVTLLVSGEHENMYQGDTLWIVEAANGERHIFNEKGLRILNENVTVLKDESLGGVQREYHEVKRKARAGERIKIVKRWFNEDRYVNGDIFVTSSVRQSDGYIRVDSLGERVIALEEYVVLEPTDVVRIDDLDGVNRGYRMVDRKAAVGERVIIVSTDKTEEDHTRVVHPIGKVGEVSTSHDPDVLGAGRVRIGSWFVVDGDYRVLEPIETAKSAETAPALSAQPPFDQAAANISALQAQVQALESRVAALEKANQPVKVAEGPADDTPPSFNVPPMPRAKSPQQIRDEIVERAKADVKALLSRNYPWADGYHPSIWFTDKDGSYITDKCDFIINRDKRTVVALISEIGGRTFRKGIAKCAPNDVFNVHIGEAIALRRALGLEVPAGYLSVPNPTEPRVGDVILFHGTNHDHNVVGTLEKRAAEFDGKGFGNNAFHWTRPGWIADKQYRIIDDSREEVGA